MVIPLGPGKFYGSSLPRPRFYTDIKYNTERVDPPLSILDPLLHWANEVHWSMGGLSFHRVRLQGKIEGKIEKLRSDYEKVIRTKKRESESYGVSLSPPNAPMVKKSRQFVKLIDEKEIIELEKVVTRAGSRLVRKLHATISKNRRRLVKLIDEKEEEEEIQEVEKCVRPKLVRKLVDEFDRVASDDFSKNVRSGDSGGGLMKGRMMKVAENLSNVASRTRGKIYSDDEDVKSVRVTTGKKKLKKIDDKSLSVIRTSPRLSKNSGSV